MRRHQRRSGTVLLVVTIVIMLLSLAAYQYVFSTETEHMAIALTGQRSQARQAAFSARDALSVMLELPRSQRDAWGGLDDNPACFGGDATWLLSGGPLADPSQRGVAAAMPLNGVDIPTSLGLLAHRWPLPEAARASATRSVAPVSNLNPLEQEPPLYYGAVNESAKLHLGKLLEWEQSAPGHGVLALLQLPGMTTATASAILDWIDADDLPHPEGAETRFYQQLRRPIAPRQGLPPDLDELLFVKGVTAAALHGDPVAVQTALTNPNATGLESPNGGLGRQSVKERATRTNRRQSAVLSEAEVRPWQDLLTVCSAERNEAHDGTPRVNLNQTDLTELHTQLLKLFPAAWADFIVSYRQYGGVPTLTSAGTNPPPLDLSAPAQFEILHPLDLVGAQVQVPVGDDGNAILSSPWATDSLALTESLPQLLDYVTLTSNTHIWGRININLAPAEVLATIPGVVPEVIEAIVSARDRPAAPDRLRTHPVWIWTEGVVDLPTLRILLPELTCGGDVFRADLWGFEDAAGPWFHAQTILDASRGSTRSVYHRELSAPRNAVEIAPLGPQNGLESASGARPRSRPTHSPTSSRQRQGD